MLKMTIVILCVKSILFPARNIEIKRASRVTSTALINTRSNIGYLTTILDVNGKAIWDPDNILDLLFSKLNWSNIFNQVEFRKVTTEHKCLNSLAQYMCNMFG